MPYTANHHVLQMFGRILSAPDEDIWTSSIRFGDSIDTFGLPDFLDPDDNVNVHLTNISADLSTWWNSLSTVFGQDVKFSGFKFNAVGVDGRYRNQGRTYRRDFVGELNGAGGANLPPQCAAAVTFRTDVSRGLAATGRMFLPPLGISQLAGGGRIQTAGAELIATRTAILLQALGDHEGTDAGNDWGRPCVMSKTRLGASRVIRGVDVGNVFDTIRSRRNALREVRSATKVVGGIA